MQSLNINTAKIDKTALYEGKKGKYLSLTLMENKDGKDDYDNDGFIVQDIGKQRREVGERGPIVGNWKYVGQQYVKSPEYGQKEAPRGSGPGMPPAPARDNGGAEYPDDDSIPFARKEWMA